MSSFRRSILGMIADGMLYVRASEKGYEVFGKDSVDRNVVIARRRDLDGAVADGSKAARILAGMKQRTVQLDILSERFERFSPEDGE